MSSIAENIQAIRQRMAAAAIAAGRAPESVQLVGASKMNGAEACRAAIAAGIDALGENRVQELLEKDAQGPTRGRRCTLSATSSATRCARSWAGWR